MSKKTFKSVRIGRKKPVDNPGSNPGGPEPASPPPLPPTLAELAASIVQHLGRATHDAAQRLHRTMSGESVFAIDADRRMAVALANRVIQLLPLFEKFPQPPDPNLRYVPACPICGAPPGKHWAHDCPTIHPNLRECSVYDYRTNRWARYKDRINPERDKGDYAAGMIPRCGVCGAGPGEHWPDACPTNPIRDKMFLDRVIPPSAQLPKSDAGPNGPTTQEPSPLPSRRAGIPGEGERDEERS